MKRLNPTEERVIKERVKAFMLRAGWRLADVAQECGVPAQTLRFWTGDTFRRLRPKTLKKVVTWIDEEEGVNNG